jgi:hypothetical protein
MPNHLDFLLLLDDYTRDSPGACVSRGADMYEIAHKAGLVEWGNLLPATWAGELVHLGYLVHGPKGLGDRWPDVPGPAWTDREVQRYHDYRVTSTGREEADRMRRLQREAATEAVLGARFPVLVRPWMTDGQRHAITEPLMRLQSTLDGEQGSAAIGAAKELVEAACKITIERAGQTPAKGASLPALFKQAHAGMADAPGSPVGNGLAATVQRLAELRNSVGTGHGRASSSAVPSRDARIAASAGMAVAEFLLSAP